MQRLDKILKHNIPKVCTQLIYRFLCIPKGSIFEYIYCPKSDNANINYRRRSIYVVHKCTEKYVWLVGYIMWQNKLHLTNDNYIKKKIYWHKDTPHLRFGLQDFKLNSKISKEHGIIQSDL